MNIKQIHGYTPAVPAVRRYKGENQKFKVTPDPRASYIVRSRIES